MGTLEPVNSVKERSYLTTGQTCDDGSRDKVDVFTVTHHISFIIIDVRHIPNSSYCFGCISCNSLAFYFFFLHIYGYLLFFFLLLLLFNDNNNNTTNNSNSDNNYVIVLYIVTSCC